MTYTIDNDGVTVRVNGIFWAKADNKAHAQQIVALLMDDGVEAWGEDPADYLAEDDDPAAEAL